MKGATGTGKAQKKATGDKASAAKKSTRKSKIAKPSSSAGSGNGAELHRVKSGDTLWDISKKYLGSGSLFREIQRINKLRGKTKILPGQNLVIPLR